MFDSGVSSGKADKRLMPTDFGAAKRTSEFLTETGTPAPPPNEWANCMRR